MKRYIIPLFMLSFLFLFIINCADFDKFSDEADILSVNIYDIDSSNIEIVGKEINIPEATLKLYAKGKLNEFPLYLKTRFTTSANSSIFRSSDYQTLTFNELADTINLMVIAQSGLPKKWIINIIDQRNTTSNIEKVEIRSHTPEEIVLKNPPVTIYKNIHRVELFVEEGEDHFPLTVNSNLTLSSKAIMADTSGNITLPDEAGKINKNFTFPNLQSTIPLCILSETGDTTLWTLAIRTKYSDLADILHFKIEEYIPSNIEFGEIQIDHLNSMVIIPITGGVIDPTTFMVSISKPIIETSPNTTIGPDYSGDLNFESINKVPQITLISENEQQRIWSFKLDYPFGPQATIESFRVLQTTPEDITLVKDGVIDPVNHSIQLKVTKGIRKFPLTISAEANISNTGELIDPLNKLYFKDIDAKNTIRLRSSNSEIHLWEISLRDMESEQSNENAIKTLTVKSIIPSNIIVSPTTTIQPETNKITLKITKLPAEESGKPILVETNLTISEGAFIGNNTSFIKNEDYYQGTLRFETINSVNEIKVEAANGETKLWKVALDYQPQTGNEIETFTIKSYIPAEFKIGSFIDLNKEENTIEISIIEGMEYFPLTITPELTLSENARLVTSLPLIFEKITDVIKLLVMSENGQEKIWTIKLKNNTNKNNGNEITSFQVNGILPDADLQKTEINTATQTITVYLKNTTYPLVLSAKTSISEGAEILQPLYSYSFKNADQINIISVKAQNGTIKDWKLTLKDATQQSNQAEILKVQPVSITPAYNNIRNVDIDAANAKVNVEIYEGAIYPTILQLALEISQGAELLSHTDNMFRFTDSSTPISLQIQAAEGNIKEWKIVPVVIPQPSIEVKLQTAELEKNNIVNNIKQTLILPENKIEIYNLIPDNYDNAIQLTFSSKVRYEIAGQTKTRVLSKADTYSATISIPLNQLTTEGGKIIVYNEHGASATYEIILKYQVRTQNNEAAVTAFRLNQLRPLDVPEPQVNILSDSREIVLTINGTSTFKAFSFLPEIETSAYSLLVGISNGQKLEFNEADQKVRFNIKSESGSTTNEWTIRVNYENRQNNAADVETFTITNSLPQEIKLGVPKIDKDNKLITVDILNWIKNQTLYLSPQLVLSSNATCNLSEIVSFENPNGSQSFTVTAENGRTENWTIKLHYTAGSDADITGFTILSHLPEEVELNPEVQINKSLQEVVIPILNTPEFPIRIRPEISVSKGAAALNAPLEYVFNNLSDIKTLQVEAEDGLVKEWKIRLGYTFNNEANVVAMGIGSVPPVVSLGDIIVNATKQTVEINVNNWNGYTEFSLTPEFTLSKGATLKGIDATVTFVQKKTEEIKFTVVAEDGTTEKTWTLQVVYHESNKTNLASFTTDTYSPSGIQMKANGEIDNTKGIVYLDIDKWNGNTELTVNKYTLATADNARTVNLPATLSFTKGSIETISFKVRAQDGITERAWSIQLRYTEVSNALVTAFDVTTTNRPSLVLGTPQIGNSTITIPVQQGVRDGFTSSFLIQANAKISENSVERTQAVTLTFASIDDSKTFVVTDEYGQKKTWTVNLENRASNLAEITSFNPRNFTSTSTDLQYLKHTQNGNYYKIYVSDIASKEKYGNDKWPTITLKEGAIQLSDKAKSNIDLQLSFGVTDYSLTKNFTVTADDGITQKEYTVEFVYCPQFENSNFAQWYTNGDKVNQIGVAGKGSFWITANMEYAGAINDGASPYSPNGARLYSKEVGVAGINKFAAASLFLGTFRKPTSIGEATGDPTALTTFGVVFRGRPKKIRITCSYNKNDDQGEIWAAGNYTGHSEDRRTNSDAYGEKWFNVTNGLQTYEVDINYKNEKPLTMFSISLTSSWKGANFEGKVGAEFIVTKIELLYE